MLSRAVELKALCIKRTISGCKANGGKILQLPLPAPRTRGVLQWFHEPGGQGVVDAGKRDRGLPLVCICMEGNYQPYTTQFLSQAQESTECPRLEFSLRFLPRVASTKEGRCPSAWLYSVNSSQKPIHGAHFVGRTLSLRRAG